MEEKIVRDIPVDKVIPNPYQPRKVFSDSALEELSKSIQEYGVLQPITVRQKDNGYEFEIDLPGFAKDEVKVSLENGYMTIEAAKGLDKDEKEKETGKYIRKERYAGACTRSFYVGEEVDPGEIKAEFKHGILKLFVPKKEAKPAVEENKYIAIEG